MDDSMLDAFGIKEMEKKQYIQLSTGQKRRLHLALALISNPDIIFWMSQRRDLMSRGDYRYMNKSENSDQKEKRLFWQAMIWQKWKPYVTALQF